ncbi:hypothetical protein ACTWP6_21020 [Mycobacterium sp. 4D054]|uniref:hypothetical protein n=1 Tax=unclassified Mycobacterium TaxID=2642494 RepID=UPI0021B3011A|nr:hypothetical protein [Mycobacterium sp. SMC-8]UXA10746.1 hypothetical protein KXD97_22045 [Mycobacterium sp. SMC-8]
MAEDRWLLELRIHGVNNTKPEAMLGLDLRDVEKVAGDKLGSFWRPTAAGRAKSHLRADIEREAYSWGEMARTSLGAGSGVSRVAGALTRTGWALLLPFGLVNVAYWTRRVDDGPNDRTDGQPQRRSRWGHGAATLRVAALLLTVLMAVTASTVVLDLVAVQCFVGQTKVCGGLPTFLDVLARLGQPRRLAVLSLVPVALIAGLLALSAATRVRYEQPESIGPVSHDRIGVTPASLRTPGAPGRSEAEAATAEPGWPLLSVAGFWSHRRITGVTARLHVAATATVVSIATAMHMLFGVDSPPHPAVQIAVVVAGIVVLMLIVVSLIKAGDYAVDVRVGLGPGRDGTRSWPQWPAVIAALLLFGCQSTVLATVYGHTEPEIRHLFGSSAVPTLLLATLIAIGLAASLWRLTAATGRRHLPSVAALVPLALLVWMILEHNDFRRTIAAALIVVSLVAFLAVRSWLIAHPPPDRGPAPSDTAWNGSAPGVFLLLATLVAMLLSSAVATAAGNWLNGANTAASLADGVKPVRGPADSPLPCCSAELASPNLEVPLPYVWFGAACLPMLLVLLVGVIPPVWTSLRWSALEPREGGHPASATAEPPRPSVLQRRRTAAIAHRAEGYVMLLVLTGTSGMLAAIGVSAWRGQNVAALRTALDLGMLVLAGSGVTLVVLTVGGSLLGGARPLGLAWDLMCFLPRAGHPLAPPCYAERAVPELIERCRVWLTSREAPAQTVAERQIVLSAHSLGSALAVAVLLSPRIADKSRISLLTYGSQLRAYFSRIFPELLGPNVLGVQACASSSLWTPDPWSHEIEAHPRRFGADEVIGASRSESVVGRLSADGRLRWRNLWRRTDYLGFPAYGYPANPIDRFAEEVVRVDYLAEVQTHSDYPRAPAYWAALAELLADEPAPPLPDVTDVTGGT